MSARLLVAVVAGLLVAADDPPQEGGDVLVDIPRPSRWVVVGTIAAQEGERPVGVTFEEGGLGVQMAVTCKFDFPRAGGGRLRGESTTALWCEVTPSPRTPRLRLLDGEVCVWMAGDRMVLELPEKNRFLGRETVLRLKRAR